MKIAVIGYGTHETPSTRFRFMNYHARYREEGHQLVFVYKKDATSTEFWSELESASLIVNQKCLFPEKIGRRILALGKPVFFDFDDALWTRPGKPYSWVTRMRVNKRLKFWLKNTSGVMVANSYLANYASKFSDNVAVIPMALDTEQWTPKSPDKTEDVLTLGWNGAPHNLRQLETLEAPLLEMFKNFPNIRLNILCGGRPNWNVPYSYYPFGSMAEPEFISQLSAGLLPLGDSAYARGKSPIKALQCLACGVPVIGHLLNGGCDFLSPENMFEVVGNDWTSVLTCVAENRDALKEKGDAGRALVEQHFSLDHTFQKMLNFFARSVPS